jgi:DNA-binding PucR family transcriptional regulator
MKMRDRNGLFETLTHYLVLGSITDVAERTYRHRNTVRNRLLTVENATGLSLSVPADAARLVMAMEWLQTAPGRAFRRQYETPG